LPWFRFRRKHDDDATAEPVAATRPDRSGPAVAEAVAEAAASTDPTKPKRRRGSRGGRGRKKSGAAAAETAQPQTQKPAKTQAQKPAKTEAQKPAKTEARKPAKAEARKPERKQLSQRQERRREQGRRRQPPRRAPLPAAKRQLLVSVDVGEQRVAVLEDDRVAEVYLERPERRSIAGNIYLGVVDNVLPGMEAAFVEIGLEKNGFLYVDEIVGPELERGHGRKIQDLISRGQKILVQAVKDPMKTKGARLTTQISLPGRFVVFVPQGEGLGVSRRLDDDERTRLKDILKRLDVKEGGVIVRTAAEGASEEDIERDLVFLQRLWRSIEARAKTATAPELVYQEAELPLRVVRDLFTGDFEKAVVDNERAYKRIVGYLKKTSPHMVERVVRYKEPAPLMDAFGVEQEIKSTLGRRVDLPSGGYLIFDYAEAFTVVDVNTGRFVGSRGKNSGGRLEDTITKNNLEAVKEVVRQLRLRDIGGIIVIDFIDMANPKNRATVEEALRSELERDRTKTYVVEISPLGLVEMTRQNVTEGPREVMTRKCPTCGGDGIVYSEASAAIDVERRLRALAAGSRSQAFRVAVAEPIASVLVGPGARRLVELEALTKRRFFLDGRPGLHLDHFVVLAEGKLADLAPEAPVEEGAEVMLQLVEVDRHDGAAAVGRLDGLAVVVAGAAPLVGKRQKVLIERVLDGSAYATLARKPKQLPEPLTAEAEAEKPTRKPPARKAAAVAEASEPADGKTPAEEPAGEAEEVPEEDVTAPDLPETTAETEVETEVEAPAEAGEESAEQAPKRKTRRGSRGGRKRRKKPVAAAAETSATSDGGAEAVEGAAEDAPVEPAGEPATVRIHVPAEDLGRPASLDAGAAAAEQAPDEPGEEPEPETEAEPRPKRKTRRGSRGGRKRRKPPAAADNGAPGDASHAEEGPASDATPDEEPVSSNGDSDEWEYVPMSEWLDEIESGR
jgi:ribonuclease G